MLCPPAIKFYIFTYIFNVSKCFNNFSRVKNMVVYLKTFTAKLESYKLNSFQSFFHPEVLNSYHINLL